ncbi:MAG: hypothetical protein HFF04_01685 [Oscillospiraceae bacterium]|nr:hypothetical protein [Oscillospiraceae bacterium]
MSKKYALFLTVLFCGFLGVMVTANALTPDREFSQVENRPLAQRPALSLQSLVSGDFMSDYETYVTDQFPGRDGWTAAKAYAEKLVGKQENNGVYFCADSTLISRFDAPDEKRVANNAKYVAQFAEKAGVPVTFGLIPTQAYVWADKLPQGAPTYDQRTVYADVAGALPDTITLVDSLWTALPDHKDEGIFYRTDHHWTSLGAYYGYTAVMEALGLGDEVLPLSTYQKTTVSDEFYGTVFSSSGVRWVEPDEMDVYVPEEGITVTSRIYDASGKITEEPRQLYDESFLEKKDKYSMFLGGQQALGIVKTGNADKPKLLIIRDSYSDSLVPFLTPHFSEIHLIDPRYYKLSASQYIADNGIDQALVLYSVPNFVTDANLVWITR